MKFEFNMAVKAVPMADVKVSIDCNVDELSVMLSDPVYQELGHMLVAKLSQQSSRPNRSNDRNQSQANQHRQEAHQAQQKARDEAIQKLLETISSQLGRANHRNF